MLSLNTEEESRSKVLVCKDARSEGLVVDVLKDIVTVDIANQPPDAGKEKPGHKEAGNKGQKSEAPLHVHHCGKNILKKYQQMKQV